jgi:hypothetical protein
MEELFREWSQRIKIYLAKIDVEDPYEKNTKIVELPSIPISAIVNDLSFSRIQWVMSGIITSQAKEIYVEKKHKNLIENCYKIEINGEFFEGFRINNKMAIKEEGSYLRIYCYKKQV